jgi:hypothetical protein
MIKNKDRVYLQQDGYTEYQTTATIGEEGDERGDKMAIASSARGGRLCYRR